jgi:DNA-binding Xre family transcriptional regulator
VQFARKTGISSSTILRHEAAQQNITLDTLESLLGKLKCRMSDIFAE